MDEHGTLLADHTRQSTPSQLTPDPTQTHRSPTDHRIFEQSTSDIWGALAACSKAVLKASGVDPSDVKGIGFDATCSLAVVDKAGNPVSVSRTGGSETDEDDSHVGSNSQWNVILWADHRAEAEAETINASGEGVLNFVGGTMSVGFPRFTHISSRWRLQRHCG